MFHGSAFGLFIVSEGCFMGLRLVYLLIVRGVSWVCVWFIYCECGVFHGSVFSIFIDSAGCFMGLCLGYLLVVRGVSWDSVYYIYW